MQVRSLEGLEHVLCVLCQCNGPTCCWTALQASSKAGSTCRSTIKQEYQPPKFTWLRLRTCAAPIAGSSADLSCNMPLNLTMLRSRSSNNLVCSKPLILPMLRSGSPGSLLYSMPLIMPMLCTGSSGNLLCSMPLNMPMLGTTSFDNLVFDKPLIMPML